MAKSDDPALYESGFERIEKDRYWTEPWLTSALLHVLEEEEDPLICRIWEPAAGRGDIVNVLLDNGYDAFASDIDLSEFDPNTCPCEVADFLAETTAAPSDACAIITNPPYDKAEKFVRRAVNTPNIYFVAMLLRSEFAAAKGRMDLFTVESGFAYEIKLTTRPRWDWWFREKPEAGPRHNFSWFVWDWRDHMKSYFRSEIGAPSVYWRSKGVPKVKKET